MPPKNHSVKPQIAVVIPCFRVRDQILQVIADIGPEVGWIYAVDDACPQKTGEWIRTQCTDSRVTVVMHAVRAFPCKL